MMNNDYKPFLVISSFTMLPLVGSFFPLSLQAKGKPAFSTKHIFMNCSYKLLCYNK